MEPVYVHSLSAGDTRKYRKSSEKSQRRHFICFNVIDCDTVLTSASWMRANSLLEQLVSRDERANTTHLGNPPPRRLVDDSGQGTGDAGRITVACEHQFKQHCKAVDAVDTFRRVRSNHPELGQLGPMVVSGHFKRCVFLEGVSGHRACLGIFDGHCSSL